MFDLLGRTIARRPRITILVWAVVAGVCFALASLGVGGETVFDRLDTGAPGVPGSESARGDELIAEASTTGQSLTLAVRGVDPRSTDLTRPMTQLHEQLMAVPGVATVIDPYVVPEGPASPAAAPLVAADGEGFLVVVELEHALPDDEAAAALNQVEGLLRAAPAELSSGDRAVTGRVGGTSLIMDEIRTQVEQDLRTGEAVSLPVALVVMVLVFGGFLAAAMPMVGALASIAAGLGTVYGLSYLMDLDSSVINVVTILSLGLSIDYGLLIVSRFREELRRRVAAPGGGRRRRGDDAVARAVVATMTTAGRTVTFSALTVALSVAGLLVFRPDILRAISAAGVAVLVIALATALTLVPALLVLAGRRLDRPGALGAVPGLGRVLARTGDVHAEEGLFSAIAARVQRHPWWWMSGCLAVLVLLAVPAGRLELRTSGTELLPAGSTQRQFVELISAQYPAAAAPAVTVVAETSLDDAATWARQLSRLDGVAAVDAPAARGSLVVLGVRPDSDDPGGPTARDVVLQVRAADPGFSFRVTGQAAQQVDFNAALADRAGWAVLIVSVATLVLLFLMTGSVVIPVKTLLTNALSLGASLGVLVWAFQDGALEAVLGFSSVGGIETYVVALVVAFAFGLAMDYEVFLLSRIKELHDEGRDDAEAVRLGLQRSGRIITSAAAIIVVVFAGFVAGQLLVIKEVGFALAVAVIVDATLVRVLLVPATMTLLGRWNWWAPAPLKRLHERLTAGH